MRARATLVKAIGIAIVLSSTAVSASTTGYGYITQLYGVSTGAVLFNTSGNRTTPPSCQGTAPEVTPRFALDASTVAGQAQVAILLNAFNLHKRIAIGGSGACTIQPDTETVGHFLVED